MSTNIKYFGALEAISTMCFYKTSFEVALLIHEQIVDDCDCEEIPKHSKSNPDAYEVGMQPDYDFFMDDAPEALLMNGFQAGYDYDEADMPE